MARYDYDCAACLTRFEVVHGVHAEPPTSCPACGGGPIKKAFAPPTIHFKGTGWAKKERRAVASGSSTKGGDGEKPGSSSEGDVGSTKAASNAGGESPTKSADTAVKTAQTPAPATAD
jgi:putative FmdB family regulatory protein